MGTIAVRCAHPTHMVLAAWQISHGSDPAPMAHCHHRGDTTGSSTHANGAPMRIPAMRFLLAGLACVAAGGAASAEDRDGSVIGHWKGTYTCAQGLTGITLTIAEATPTSARALFHFYADARNPGVPTGCFTMSGAYRPGDGTLRLRGREWIIKPPEYQTVGFYGVVDALGSAFSGNVHGPGCTRFALTRIDAPGEDAGQCRLEIPALMGDLTAKGISDFLARDGRVELHIPFAFDKTEIAREAESQLDELGRTIASSTFADRRIGIHGHTDGSGSDDYNRRLSLARADAIALYLGQRFGISAERFTVKGFGASLLKNPGDPLDAVNRRVEVVLLDP